MEKCKRCGEDAHPSTTCDASFPIEDVVLKLSSFDKDCRVFVSDPGSLVVRLKNGECINIISF